jgi:hypothetical protein
VSKFSQDGIAPEDRIPAGLPEHLRPYLALTREELSSFKQALISGALEGARIAADELMLSLKRWIIACFVLTAIHVIAFWSVMLVLIFR